MKTPGVFEGAQYNFHELLKQALQNKVAICTKLADACILELYRLRILGYCLLHIIIYIYMYVCMYLCIYASSWLDLGPTEKEQRVPGP